MIKKKGLSFSQGLERGKDQGKSILDSGLRSHVSALVISMNKLKSAFVSGEDSRNANSLGLEVSRSYIY